jgi:transposase
MKKNTNYVGIDISKLTFDVAIENEAGKYVYHKMNNNTEGFKKLLVLLNKEKHSCVMEASGPYYLKLAMFLHENTIAVSVINPLVIRRFSQMRMMRAKTDKKDALMIAEYGKTEMHQCWIPEADYVLELRQMQALLDQLNKSRTGLIRQQEAFAQNPVKCLVVNSSIEKVIKSIEIEMESVEAQMESIVNDIIMSYLNKLKAYLVLERKQQCN